MTKYFISSSFRINPNVANEIRKEDMTPAYIMLLKLLKDLGNKKVSNKVHSTFADVNSVFKSLSAIPNIKSYEYFYNLAFKDFRDRIRHMVCPEKVLQLMDSSIVGMFRKHRRRTLMANPDVPNYMRVQFQAEQLRHDKDMAKFIAKGF
jgi:hypothetical protein